jgi:hypothetical protein
MVIAGQCLVGRRGQGDDLLLLQQMGAGRQLGELAVEIAGEAARGAFDR